MWFSAPRGKRGSLCHCLAKVRAELTSFPSVVASFSRTAVKQVRHPCVTGKLLGGEAQAPKEATLAPNWQQENFSKSSAPLVLTGVGLGFNSDYIANTFLWDNWLIAGIDENHRTSGVIKTLEKAVLTLREIILLLTLGVNHRSSYSSFNRAVNRLANMKRAKHFNTITESSARHPAVQGPKCHFCYWILVLYWPFRLQLWWYNTFSSNLFYLKQVVDYQYKVSVI